MKARMLFGYALVAAIAAGVLGCGGGGGSSNAPQAVGKGVGTVALTIDNSRKPANSARNPKYIPPGTTDYSYTVYQGSTVIKTASGTFGSCPTSGPCTITITLPSGNGYDMSVTISSGSQVIGSGVSGSFSIVDGANIPVTVAVSPIVATIDLSPNSPPPVWYADGTSQSATGDVLVYDTLSNIISTIYGPIPNWSPVPVISSAGCSGVNAIPTAIPVPTSTAPFTVQYNYDGSPCSGSTTVNLNVQSGSVSATPMAIPIVQYTHAPDVNFAATAAPTTVVFTETNSTNTGFTPHDNCGGALVTSAPVPVASGNDMRVTYTLSVNAVASPCAFWSQPSDRNALGANSPPYNGQVNIFPPGSVVVTPQTKRGKH